MFHTALVLILCLVAYMFTRHTIAGWALLISLWVTLWSWTTLATRSWWARAGWVGGLAFMAGAGPVAFAQIEGRFSDEEFFAALQAALLSTEWLLLWLVVTLVRRRWFASRASRALPMTLAVGMLGGIAAGAVVMLVAYQRSFYPPTAPLYPGISADAPFICGDVTPAPQTYDGQDVFNRLVAQVEANPRKGAPEFGMLALTRNDLTQAQGFREALLTEARAGEFTHPANSVKFIQYQASFRIYYYSRVRAAFPALFSAAEEAELREWFAAINRRALTVEWVDWMYASALGEWPTGPYENQENGAGLLALLEANHLSAPDLSLANQTYLNRTPRGWAARFRNTDDAFIYQPEWINNAFFHWLNGGTTNAVNERLSFEWLLLQALPDGNALSYNHPAQNSLAGVLYLGAERLNDPRYVWLAGRALEAENENLNAQPGTETPLAVIGQSPTEGTCLMYGDSGMPNQHGPLAVDKLVFRDGWASGSSYLLINLRFTGWHRYKATNTVALFYQQGELLGDDLNDGPIGWLPTGRTLFRDKRIPRENLNGLVIEHTGLSAVLYALTGVGSRWAQDPPYYAMVERFETGDEVDVSRTIIEDWHGWQHTRTVYFYHGGPVIIADEIVGPAGGEAALTWQLPANRSENLESGRFTLRGGESPAELLLVPIEVGPLVFEPNASTTTLYVTTAKGRLRALNIFLLDDWVGAQAEGVDDKLRLTQAGKELLIPVWSAP